MKRQALGSKALEDANKFGMDVYICNYRDS